VLNSAAFSRCRLEAEQVVQDPEALRDLAHRVRLTIGRPGPLEAVVAQVLACEQFLLHLANELSTGVWLWAVEGDTELDETGHLPEPDPLPDAAGQSPAVRARRRLLVATLLYLVLVDDLRPDDLTGGFVDDALLVSWVTGVAARELSPFLSE
jgi:hypothetical protein